MVDVDAHQRPIAGQTHQRDQRKRNTERQHHLREHQARVGSVPSATTTNAGTRVIKRRASSGIRLRSSPSMIKDPA